MNIKTNKKQTKEIRKSIETLIKEGHTKDDIYYRLTEQYENSGLIAKSLCWVVDKNTKEKYKKLNYVLVGLLILLGILRFLSILGTMPNIPIIVLILVAFFLPVIFIIEVLKYNSSAYKAVFFILLAGGLRSLSTDLNYISMGTPWFYVSLVLFSFTRDTLNLESI